MTEPAARTAEPTILRSLLLAAGAVAALIWLLPDPDVVPRDLADGREWWARTETAAAAIIVVRLIGSAMAILAGGLATLALVAALGPWATPSRIWRRLSPTPLRRLVTASILIGIANDPISNASAAEHDSAPLPVLADLGPSARRPSPDAAPPILIDLGVVDPEPADTGVGFTAPTDPNPPDGERRSLDRRARRSPLAHRRGDARRSRRRTNHPPHRALLATPHRCQPVRGRRQPRPDPAGDGDRFAGMRLRTGSSDRGRRVGGRRRRRPCRGSPRAPGDRSTGW